MKVDIELGDATFTVEGDAAAVQQLWTAFSSTLQQTVAAHISGNQDTTLPSGNPDPAPVIAPVVAPVVAPSAPVASAAPVPTTTGTNGGTAASPSGS